MAARLRAKPGGGDIVVTMGDFADVAVPGTYCLAYVVYNTFFNLLTQDWAGWNGEPFTATSERHISVYRR
jgi:hypothetical protein